MSSSYFWINLRAILTLNHSWQTLAATTLKERKLMPVHSFCKNRAKRPLSGSLLAEEEGGIASSLICWTRWASLNALPMRCLRPALNLWWYPTLNLNRGLQAACRDKKKSNLRRSSRFSCSEKRQIGSWTTSSIARSTYSTCRTIRQQSHCPHNSWRTSKTR